MQGLLPALFLCSLSTAHSLTCRTEDGTALVLKEGALRFDDLKVLRVVDVRKEGLCVVAAPEGALLCFNGGGERILWQDPSGRNAQVSGLEGATRSRGEVCAMIRGAPGQGGKRSLATSGLLRCFSSDGKEMEFFERGAPVKLEGLSRFTLGEGFLCALGTEKPLTCFVVRANRFDLVDLRAESGRILEADELRVKDFLVEGSHVCYLLEKKGILCADSSGVAIPLRNKAGFTTKVDASHGFALSAGTLCSLDGARAATCRDLDTGKPWEFRNALGFTEEPPQASVLRLHGETVCLESPGPIEGRKEKPDTSFPSLACYRAGSRVVFSSVSGAREDVPAVGRLTVHAGRICGVDAKGLLRCWLSTGSHPGAEVKFTGSLGFRGEVNAARGYALGSDAICAVTPLREARCFRPSGEEVILRGPLGGAVRLEDVENIFPVTPP